MATTDLSIQRKIEVFALACKNLNSNQIFLLFEECLTDEVRDIVIQQGDPESLERFRAACDAIGAKYNINSLKEY